MKRLRRILFNTLTAISLLLAIATAGLWVRSVTVGDWFSANTISRTAAGEFVFVAHQLSCVDGGFFYIAEETPIIAPPDTQPHSVWEGEWRRERVVHNSSLLRRVFPQDLIPLFRHRVVQTVVQTKVVKIASCPIWLLVLLTSALPASRTFLWIRSRRRTRPGLCPACGYDTRANPQKCSECGHDIASGIS